MTSPWPYTGKAAPQAKPMASSAAPQRPARDLTCWLYFRTLRDITHKYKMYLITTQGARPPALPRAPVSTQVYSADLTAAQAAATYDNGPTCLQQRRVWEEETTQISIAAIVLRALIR